MRIINGVTKIVIEKTLTDIQALKHEKLQLYKLLRCAFIMQLKGVWLESFFTELIRWLRRRYEKENTVSIATIKMWSKQYRALSQIQNRGAALLQEIFTEYYSLPSNADTYFSVTVGPFWNKVMSEYTYDETL